MFGFYPFSGASFSGLSGTSYILSASDSIVLSDYGDSSGWLPIPTPSGVWASVPTTSNDWVSITQPSNTWTKITT